MVVFEYCGDAELSVSEDLKMIHVNHLDVHPDRQSVRACRQLFGPQKRPYGASSYEELRNALETLSRHGHTISLTKETLRSLYNETDIDWSFDVSPRYSDDWELRKREVFARDGYTCTECGASSTEIHAHHIEPLSAGGSNDLSNLTTLCSSCHEAKHPHM
jgi:5-methylcytosine-specific restriction endonuclease McrA